MWPASTHSYYSLRTCAGAGAAADAARPGRNVLQAGGGCEFTYKQQAGLQSCCQLLAAIW